MRIGVIGFGNWGKVLCRCFSEASLEVSFIAEIAPERCEEARRGFPGALHALSSAELLATGDIDAVAIATPASTHFDIAREALEAGKHVWIEKPVAETADQARALALLAQRRGCVLFIDHTFLYSSSIRLIKRMLAQKEFAGMRRYESVRTNDGQPRRDTSIFHDLTIHDLAILDFLLGEPPLAVSATRMPAQGASASGDQCIALSYASGVTAGIRVNWCASAKVRRIAISSSRQTVEFDDMQPHHKVWIHEYPLAASTEHESCDLSSGRQNGRLLSPQDQREALANAVECFLDSIRTGQKPVSDGWQGVRLAAIVHACLSSSKADGRWTDVAPMVDTD
jgi:predicted dehydrogenase